MAILQQIIDRRLSGKNKSIGNRERFIKRYKGQLQEAVKKALDGRSIRDLDKGADVTLPKRDVAEPTFGHASGGDRERVHPGNREYVTGDKIKRPESGSGSGSGSGKGDASDSGEGEDDFTFTLTREEFMQFFFDGLALPDLIKTQIADVPEWRSHRAGFTSDGTPNNLSVVRSMRGALARRIALGGDDRKELRRLEAHLADLMAHPQATTALIEREVLKTEELIAELRRTMRHVPYIDPIDLRYRNRVKTPVPTARAVMFCLMDVSGSMDEDRKSLAKRFFMLLYMFLTRHYEKIELVFIRHHTVASEVTEDEFFHATESGGTIVSSALDLMDKIIKARYAGSDWNIYGAQASDGDNWSTDNDNCRKILSESLLPAVRYFAYMQVVDHQQDIWYTYSSLVAAHPNFAMRKVSVASDIYPVFCDLFKKKGSVS